MPESLNMSTNSIPSPQEIVDDLALFDGHYKREEIDAAAARKDEIAPLLVRLIEVGIADGHDAPAENDIGVLMALMLLSDWGVESAHQILIKLARLPENRLNALLGDCVTEELSWALYATCAGEVTSIRHLACDNTVMVWSRDAALKAMLYGVCEGKFSKEEMLGLLRKLIKEPISYDGLDFRDVAGATALDLGCVEILDDLEELYSSGTVVGHMIGLRDIRRQRERLSGGVDEYVLRELAFRRNSTIHERFGEWAMFTDADDCSVEEDLGDSGAWDRFERDRIADNDQFSNCETRDCKKHKKKQATKRKAQKKARKKNRRL